MSQKDVIILSVPYCEPLPLVAPVLLAGCLENAGISAKGIDFNIKFIEKFSSRNWWSDMKNMLTIGHMTEQKFKKSTYKEVLRFVKNFLLDLKNEYNPKYIGLSIFTSESLDFGLVLSFFIRRYLPNVEIIIGGKGLEVSDGTDKHYATWMKYGVADIAIVGDAETEFIETIKNSKKGIIYAKKQSKDDLDNIPLAKWSDYDLDIYQEFSKELDRDTKKEEPYLTITASKGCVRKCTFCDVANFWPDYIYRDPVKVAHEIAHNFKNTGIKKFKFTDNLINGSVSNFRIMNEELCKIIPNTITYSGFAIFRGKHQMPESDFELASRAGCSRWTIGVESGSEKVRYDMKKKFNNDDLDWSAFQLLKYRIQQNWLLMVGYPTETDEDFDDTIKLLKKYHLYAINDKITISVSPFNMLENSPLIYNRELRDELGLSHIEKTHGLNSKFWFSTKYTDNDYPKRSERWKKVMSLAEDLGYSFGSGMPVKKWWDEVINADRIYEEQKHKVIRIHTEQ